MKNHTTQNRFVRAIKKFLLSALVVSTFIAYALENRRTPVAVGIPATAASPAATVARPAATAVATQVAGAPASTAPPMVTTPAVPATAVATPTAEPTTSSGLKDGTYTGPAVDVNWGYIQIQTTIRSGRISDVQFLQYPNDRRTSVRINTIADPELVQEAIQAQSASVDIITGATLTSEGFQESLQAALSQAQG